jgi:hypothetical protein
MMDLYTKKNVTLEEVNDRLIVRFLGGIFFLSILMVVGLIGNAHVLFIYHRKFRRTNYRIYVLWLAMLDMFNCGISAPFVIFYLLHPANFPSSEFCKIFRFILYFCVVANPGIPVGSEFIPKRMGAGQDNVNATMRLNKHMTFAWVEVICDFNGAMWLAMLDMFNCGISAPFVIFYLLHPANFPSSEFCKIFRFILYFCGVASTASLVPIAIDRGRKILAPLKSQITSTQAKVMCLLSLIVALTLSWPAPILFGINSEPTGIPGTNVTTSNVKVDLCKLVKRGIELLLLNMSEFTDDC